MKAEFVEYIKAIGLTETLTHRVHAFHDFCRVVCPDEIERIFISEYITQEGGRVFESVWFISNMYAMEAKEFAVKEDYDIALVSQPIGYLSVQMQDYDLSKATEKSRLTIKVILSGVGLAGTSGGMKASKENCDFLWKLIREYFLPKLKLKA